MLKETTAASQSRAVQAGEVFASLLALGSESSDRPKFSPWAGKSTREFNALLRDG